MYMFLFLGLLTTLIFSYLPMYGLLMAFQDAKIGTIIGQAEWVGLHHFDKFVNGLWFKDVMINTFIYGMAGTFFYWPAALALALLLHNSTLRQLAAACHPLHDPLHKAGQHLHHALQ